ncbi:MAG: flagellar basal body P-ring formation protein FlgA [Betaproteobacteria bacterium HGW-Betaproteobacteria-19]|nr:MAG: flagellar basal body P-ring formation protein FlgA [Betaproteobacteria bacterium HGW-Betaproteobacteria-19]
MRIQAPRLIPTLVVLLITLGSGPLLAQQAPEPVETVARNFLEQETRGLPGRVEIQISPLDARNQLPPCADLIAFLPGGVRAWGALSVGVRCDSPVTWSVYLQARVGVVTDYLVVARPLRAGQIVGPADIARRHGDLAALPDNTLTDPTQAIGHHTRYAIAQGNPLRGDMLRIPAAVRQGQNVKVISSGEGFQVSGEGRALNNAAPGETVRVRMPNGQVITGTASAGGLVEIRY